jgi:hypothetical protein
MRAHSLNPRHGLLVGLLALIVFVSAAVAMTAGAPGNGTASATQAAAGGRGDDGLRFAVGRDRDGDAGFGGRGR